MLQAASIRIEDKTPRRKGRLGPGSLGGKKDEQQPSQNKGANHAGV